MCCRLATFGCCAPCTPVSATAPGTTGPGISHAGLTALTAAPPGPGFFEIGEELALAGTQRGLLTAVVVGGRDGAALETAMFSAPPAATAPQGRTAMPATGVHSMPGTGAARAANGRLSGFAATGAWLGAAALALCCAAAVTAVALRRRRPGAGPPARHPPDHSRR